MRAKATNRNAGFRRVQLTRVYVKVAHQIKRLIASGQLKPGDQLPTERQLEARLKVGRSSIREALRSLETMGLVVIRHGSGTYVTDANAENLATELAAQIIKAEGDPADLMEARRLIEPEIAALAAQRARPEDLAALHEAVERMQGEAEANRGDREPDIAFHKALAKAAQNPVLEQLAGGLCDLRRHLPWQVTMNKTLAAGAWQAAYVRQHGRVLKAIEQHQAPLARRRMQALLRTVNPDLGKPARPVGRTNKTTNDPEHR